MVAANSKYRQVGETFTHETTNGSEIVETTYEVIDADEYSTRVKVIKIEVRPDWSDLS